MELSPILLVEDNPDDELLVRRCLSGNGFGHPIVSVHDGQEALDYLFDETTDMKALPVLVLLDLRLPRVNGHEVLRRIRANDRTKLLPVVILTSSDEEEDILESYRNGANSYVRKPVKFEDFGKAVYNLGLFWTLTNVGPPTQEV
ncbi:response regulator [Pseudomonadota bacterium]